MPEIHFINGARAALQHGALGVGEHHDSDSARHYIYEWMVSGLVTSLVLEIILFDDLTEDENDQMVGYVDNRWPGNQIPFTHLMRLARSLNIAIYAWDPGDRPGVSMPQNVANRNLTVVDAFRAQFPGPLPVTSAVGCVVLFGVSHFGAEETSINMLLGNALPWIDLSAPPPHA
jgi:hypothetical protein